MKKIFTILLCGVFVCVGAYVTTGESYAGHWADQYLNNLVSQQIMRGDDEGKLNPDDSITRAEFVAMMNRAFGYSQKGTIAFNDVPEEEWYYDDISIAKKQGYFNGIYPDTAGPDKPLKREEAVTMLCRALKIQGVESDPLQFADSRDFSGWSKEYINAAVEKKFLSGYPDQTFKPADYMKRGEMAKVLSEVAGEIVKDQGSNYIGYANGNVSVVETGASLRNTIVPGDLYITAGMGTGYTQLENITVGGDLIISGTGNAQSGEVSVILTDCDIHNLVIDSGNSNTMSVRAEGGSIIHNTTVKSSAYLEEDNSKGTAFKDVILKGPSGTTLNLSGAFENVSVNAENNKLSVDKGTVDSLTVDEDAIKGSVFIQKDTTVYALFCDTAATVTGTGKVEEVSINANGCNIAMLPEHIYIRPGVTAVVNGQTMTSVDAEANNASPEFLSTYPKYQDLQSTSVNLLAKTNKPGKVYWAVKNVDAVSSGMSEDEVKNPDKRYVIKSGNINVVGDKEVTIAVGGLTSGVNYEYYMVFEDLKENKASVEKQSFKTVDVVAPKFLNSTPKIISSTKNSITMVVMPSKNVTVSWAVLPAKSVPPTIESLSQLKVSGALAIGSERAEMNDPKEIFMQGAGDKQLVENVTYDIYMVIKDDSGNLSNLAKVTGATLDQTPPKFMDGYPWNEPSTDTSLKIRHMATEEGTLYWAVYPMDFKFPPVDNLNSITDAAIIKELKIRAITTGQKAVKSGKVTVAQEKDATLDISGLAKQTPYDVYFLLMDKAGNYSEPISLLGVKTLDKSAPVATMEFDKVISGKPTIDSDIKIVFNEIVYYYGDDGTKTRLVSLQDKSKLKNILVLYDLLKTTTNKQVSDTFIDFSKAQISEKDGKTIIIFKKDCFASGKGLNTGGSYQFEVSNIIDSDNNAMQQKTRINAFNTVPPRVFIGRYNGQVALNTQTELAFTINPDLPINSDAYYDIVLHSNQVINVDVLKVEGTTATAIASNKIIEAGQARTIADLVGPTSNRQFTKFDQLTNESYSYIIHINKMNGISNPAAWDGQLDLQAVAVIGEDTKLDGLAGKLIMANAPADPIAYIESNSDVLTVTDPTVYKMTKVYADTEQPTMERLDIEPFDTAAKVTTTADKAAKLYYVAVPVASLPPSFSPSVDLVISGLPAYRGSKSGVLEMPIARTDYVLELNELDANTQYKFFYVLRGKTAENLQVTQAAFNTKPYTKPIFENDTPRAGNEKGADFVQMMVNMNTPSTVYWVMYPSGRYTTAAGINQIKATDIRGVTNSSGDVIDFGTIEASTAAIDISTKCQHMVSGLTYDFFAVAVSKYGQQVSDVMMVEGLRSSDVTPPKIRDVNSLLAETTSGSGIYDGSVTITFTEPLYYRQDVNGQSIALTDATFTTAIFVYDSTRITDLNIVKKIFTTDEDIQKNKPLIGTVISFKGMRDGLSIGIPGSIYDASGNQAGQLVIRCESGKLIVEIK
ncbi:MAG: S-layer homology domain-containing protein [Aminipila sp.]